MLGYLAFENTAAAIIFTTNLMKCAATVTVMVGSFNHIGNCANWVDTFYSRTLWVVHLVIILNITI